MQSSILGLRTTIYKVTDLPKAKEWYSKAFRSEPYFDEPYYVGFNIGGYELGLQKEEVSIGENVATFWGVSDIAAEYAYFIECGATEVEAPMNVGDEIMVATCKDPWGNLIGLIYNPMFKGFVPAE
jgi:predicted enzyme related to lactoylglutathione lyase